MSARGEQILPNTFLGVQYLRGFAALAVVVFHFAVPLERLYGVTQWPQWLASGVDLFFVISGFIMWVTTTGKAITPATFVRHRLLRIVPLYWAVTSFLIAAALLAPGSAHTVNLDPGLIASSYLFVPHLHPKLDMMAPVLVVGWTLNYEMFFYLLFGLSLFLSEKLRLISVLSALLFLALLNALFKDPNTLAAFYTSPIILEFGFGILIAAAVGRGWRLSPTASWGLLAAGLAAIPIAGTLFPQAHRVLIFGVPAAIILASTVHLELSRKISRADGALTLGDSSYSLYLVHGIILAVIGAAWRFVPAMPFAPVVFSLCALFSCLAAGLVTYLVVERPTLKFLRRRRPELASRLATSASYDELARPDV